MMEKPSEQSRRRAVPTSPPLRLTGDRARKLVFLLGMETAEELLRFREEPELLKWLEVIRGQGLCCSLSQLSVNGEDLIRLGYPEGKGIGKALNRLLQLVLDETLENQKELLLKKAKSWMKLDAASRNSQNSIIRN